MVQNRIGPRIRTIPTVERGIMTDDHPLAGAGREAAAAVPPMLTLLIADDHPIFRSGLKWALQQSGQIADVRDVGSFDALLAALDGWTPDVAIIDLNMPGFTIPDDLRSLRQTRAGLPVLMLSASSETDDVTRALRAGASGYITKTADVTALIDAIRVILDGGVFLPNDLLAGRAEAIGMVDAPAVATPKLTRRQFEVLTCALEGHGNKQIAYRLAMSEGTVKTHLAAVMRRYGVNNRVQLVREVDRVGLS
jgi:two-component system nitrate/nitrite response regulator NarL